MKMTFGEDKYYNGELKYRKGIVYDIPEEGGQVQRWIKRGGVEVTEEETVIVSGPVHEERLTPIEELEDVQVIDEVESEEEIVEQPEKKSKRRKGKHSSHGL